MMRISFLLLLALEGILPCSLEGEEVRSEQWDALLTTRDDQKLRATFYQPAGSGPTTDADAVILVHDLGGNREDWGDLPEILRQAGYAVIALQLRGHAERDSSKHHWSRYERDGFNAMVLDILAARIWLQKQKKVHIRNMAVVGARFGANLALRSLCEDKTLGACYALSPGLSYRGVRVPEDLEGISNRPVRCVVATSDTYSLESCRKLAEAGAAVVEKEVEEFQTGMQFLKAHPEIYKDLLKWLKLAF